MGWFDCQLPAPLYYISGTPIGMSRSPRKSDYAPFPLSPERLHFGVVAGELNHARSKEYLNVTNTSSEDIV